MKKKKTTGEECPRGLGKTSSISSPLSSPLRPNRVHINPDQHLPLDSQRHGSHHPRQRASTLFPPNARYFHSISLSALPNCPPSSLSRQPCLHLSQINLAFDELQPLFTHITYTVYCTYLVPKPHPATLGRGDPASPQKASSPSRNKTQPRNAQSAV